MNCNKHLELRGLHSFLSPSNYAWLGWDNDKMARNLEASYATKIGTIIHNFAAERISFKEKIKNSDKRTVRWELIKGKVPRLFIHVDNFFKTLQMYVNDAIDIGMDTEWPLKYSDNAYGTCDAIYFDSHTNVLKIHDLKTGTTPAHMEQLLLYAAYFCLDNKIKPEKLKIELRIYQESEITCYNPTEKDIQPIIDRTIYGNKFVTSLLNYREEESDADE